MTEHLQPWTIPETDMDFARVLDAANNGFGLTLVTDDSTAYLVEQLQAAAVPDPAAAARGAALLDSAIPPATWGAKVTDYRAGVLTPWKPDGTVAVHHPTGPNINTPADAAARMRTIEAYHLANGWIRIAYNYGVGPTGEVYIGRGQNRSGGTSGDYDEDGIINNHETVAIVALIGTGQPPTDATVRSIGDLIAYFGGPGFGHVDAKGIATSCPGPHLTPWIRANPYGTPPDTPQEDDMIGPDSDTAIIRIFQNIANQYGWRDASGNKLTVDGIHGPKTAEAIAAVATRISHPDPTQIPNAALNFMQAFGGPAPVDDWAAQTTAHYSKKVKDGGPVWNGPPNPHAPRQHMQSDFVEHTVAKAHLAGADALAAAAEAFLTAADTVRGVYERFVAPPLITVTPTSDNEPD